jgi:hypothetical protein
MESTVYEKSQYRSEIKNAVMAVQSLRTSQEDASDISFEEYVSKRWGTTMESFFNDLGINTGQDVISNLYLMPDENVRWLVPEIIRSAVRLGLRKNPIWPDIIAAEQSVKALSITTPYFNMSEAAPRYVGQAETIPLGDISFGDKTLKLRKIGKGIKIPYEVLKYVAVDVVGIFLQDFGVKLNQAQDTLMIDILINGEQADGSESAPVIGVQTPGTLTYRDLLKVWIRMARIGKTPTAIIGGETAALDTLDLDEFKKREAGTTQANLDLKTPIPKNSSYYIHGAVPDDQQIIVDRSAALIKYNAQPLLIESEKIVSNQTEATYASLATGFGVIFRDGRAILDSSLDITTDGFPAYMDPSTVETVEIT